MKLALVQQACPTATGTQDYLDAGFSSDCVGAIFFTNAAAVVDTNTAAGKFSIGATDGVGSVSLGVAFSDGSSSPNDPVYVGSTTCVTTLTTGGAVRAQAALSSIQPTGVRINWTTAPASSPELISALLVGGAGAVMAAKSQQFTTGGGSKTITHSLGVIPSMILVFGDGGSTLDAATTDGHLLGIWTPSGQFGFGMQQQGATSPTNVGAQISTADVGKFINSTPALGWSVALSSVGTSTFVASTGNIQARLIFICIGSTTETLSANAGVATTPTATGTQSIPASLSGAAKLLITLGTRTTATSLDSTDSAGSWGIGISVNNNGTVQQSSVAATVKDAVSTSVCKSQNSSKSLLVLDNTGAQKIAATVTSWIASPVQTFSAVDASNACEFGWAALGAVVSGSKLLLNSVIKADSRMSTQTVFVTAGSTGNIRDINLVQKAAATSPGDPITGLAFNTASLVAYSAGGQNAATAVTLATQTSTGAYSSGGFVERSAANMPGQYRFDIPNALVASAGEVNIEFSGAPNLAPHTLKIIVTAFDLFSTINANLAAGAMTEAYPTMVGSVIQPMTVPAVLHSIHQILVNAIASGTTLTVKKLDQSTTAMTFTLNDTQNASGILRAS